MAVLNLNNRNILDKSFIDFFLPAASCFPSISWKMRVVAKCETAKRLQGVSSLVVSGCLQIMVVGLLLRVLLLLPFIFPFIWFLFGCGRIQSVIITKVTFMLMPTQNAACYVAVCGTEEMNVTRRILVPTCSLEPKTAAEEVPYCISLSTGLLSALSSVFPVMYYPSFDESKALSTG